MHTDPSDSWFAKAQALDAMVEKARDFIRSRGFTPGEFSQGANYYHMRVLEHGAGGCTVYLDSGLIVATN